MGDHAVRIWSDGACFPNPGPGGWAAVVHADKFDVELSGGERQTTNNRMEMRGAIEGLKAVGERSCILLHSDSQYVIRGMSEWMPKWRKFGLPEKNRDLWEQLIEWAGYHDVTWTWVRGHAGDPENERADALANKAIPR